MPDEIKKAELEDKFAKLKKIAVFLFSGKNYCSAVLGGIISALLFFMCLPFLRWSLLIFIALVPLMLVLRAAESWKTAAAAGASFGFVLHMTSMYWISLLECRIYGLIGLSLEKSIIPAAVCVGIYYLGVYFPIKKDDGFKALIYPAGAAALWVVGEYLQTLGVFGIVWAMLPLALARLPIFLQTNSIFGMWGLSFFLAFTNILITQIVLISVCRGFLKNSGRAYNIFNLDRESESVFSVFKIPLISAGAMLLGILFLAGINLIPNSDIGIEKSQKWAVVQVSTPQSEKFERKYQRRNFNLMAKESSMAVRRLGAEVVAWPETSIPYRSFLQRKSPQNQVKRMIERNPAYFLIGSLEHLEDGRTANAMSVWDKTGTMTGRYDKNKLVPFGEYLPGREYWPKWFPGVDAVMNFKAGDSISCLDVNDKKVGVLICFESLCNWMPRKHVLNGAEILYVPTNDIWFEDSAELPGHFDLAIMHAAALRRPVVQAGNNGISGFVDKTGRVLQESEINKCCALVENVIPEQKLTIYARFGDYFPWFCAVLYGVFIYLGRKKAKSEESEAQQ